MSSRVDDGRTSTVVLEVSGLRWATEKARVEAMLGRRPGVVEVAANPVAQTALVRFDPERTSTAQLAGWIRDCGYHCDGRSVPAHICDPLAEPGRPPEAEVVLMRSDPLDVPAALLVGRATVRKMRQNLAWAIGYNTVALPIAAGAFEPVVGLTLRPEIAALTMSGSSLLVAVNALLLKRQKLPRTSGGRQGVAAADLA